MMGTIDGSPLMNWPGHRVIEAQPQQTVSDSAGWRCSGIQDRPRWRFGRHEIDQRMKNQRLGADDSLGDEVLMDRVGFLLARKADGQVI